MFRRIDARSFEQVEKSNQIALNVSSWVLDAVTHIGLGAEMHNIVGPEVLPEALQFAGIREIQLEKTEVLPLGEVVDAGTFEGDGIVIAQVVDADDLALPRIGQAFGHMVTDEAGSTGHENFHPSRFTANAPHRLVEKCRVEGLKPPFRAKWKFHELVNFRLILEFLPYYVALRL